jgi:cytochrome b6-f complex iron-sulfur subunit
MIKRRSFLTYFGLSWLASCFPVVLAACSPTKSTTQESTAQAGTPGAEDKGGSKPTAKKAADGFTVVGTVADLKKTGSLQTKTVAVIEDPSNPQKLLAVNPKCTHEGCDVKWSTGDKKYECPCHSASFAADGKVLAGPATKALTTYPAKIVGNQILVKV